MRTADTPQTVLNKTIADADVGQLVSLATRGLVPMFDTERNIFCYRIVKVGQSLKREGLSHRYSIIALLGLRQLERAGGKSPVDVEKTFASLLEDIRWITNIGDLGLLLWLHSLVQPGAAPEWCTAAELEHALERYSDARAGSTMELSWFLTGLAHNLLTGGAPPRFADLALEAYSRLANNQGQAGFFGHMSRTATFSGRMRGSLGSFADQVYPIYAFTRLAQARDMKEPLARAVHCAKAICRVQGPLGQWWWHYHAGRGQVARQFPVFSMHQDGMAPMVLFTLGEATGLDFSENIFKGLQWIYGENELKVDMRDTANNLVWRCLVPSRTYTMYAEDLASLLGISVKPQSPDCKVVLECRPYHLGWLLYAFAPAPGQKKRPLGGTQSQLPPAVANNL